MLIAFLWCAFTLQFVGQPNITSNTDQQATSTQVPQIQSLPQNNQPSQNNTNEAAESTSEWYTSPEWWLVGVGILTLIAITVQSCATAMAVKATQESAAAARKNIELQAVQWVALKDWRGEFRQPYMFSVTVDVVNETNFPLTLEGTDFRVGTATFSGTENVTLIPDGKYSVGFIHRMSLEEATAYQNTRTAFGVRGAIRFNGIGGKRVQPFGGLIAASYRDGISFESRSEYEQSAKEHYK